MAHEWAFVQSEWISVTTHGLAYSRIVWIFYWGTVGRKSNEIVHLLNVTVIQFIFYTI